MTRVRSHRARHLSRTRPSGIVPAGLGLATARLIAPPIHGARNSDYARMDDEDKRARNGRPEPKMLERTSDSPEVVHRDILQRQTTSVANGV